MTFRTKLNAKAGSMPDEQPAMMLKLPVGAMVVVVALRMGTMLFFWAKMLFWKLGNIPR